ncbi:hypothetical protein BY458DRAFT_524848 [Sporodiniella umbellata]|nr:hypothetical protein BY458DRAFT_524848 [Sporodiniella umbellata]
MYRFFQSCSRLATFAERFPQKSMRYYSSTGLLANYRQQLEGKGLQVWEGYDHVRNELQAEDFIKLRKTLWESRSWGVEDRVIQVLEDMKRSGHAWGIKEYSEYFVAKLFLDQYQDILDVYEGDFQQHKFEKNTGSFSVLIATYLLTNQRDKAIKLIEDAKCKGQYIPTVKDISQTLDRCLPTNKQLVNDAKKLIMEHGITESQTLNLNIMHFFKQRNIAGLKELLKEYKGKLDVSSYNLLIKGFSEAKMKRETIAYYKEMEKNKIKPNAFICAYMLDIYAYARDVPSAEHVVRQTVLGGHAADEVIYNQLIKVYFKAWQPAKAFMAFQEIQNSKTLKLNEVILNTMVNGLVINKEMKAANQIYQRMLQSEFKPDIVTFNTMLKGYTDAGDTASSLEILQDMIRLKQEPDVVTFTTFINSIFDTKTPESARHMMELLKKMRVKPNIYTFNSIISRWIKNGNIEEAERTLSIMMAEYSEIRPTVHTFTNLIQGYTERMNLRKSVETFQQLLKSGVEPDTATFNFMIVGFLNFDRLEDAYVCLEKMSAMKLWPTKDTWVILFDHCIKENDRSMSKKLMDFFDQSGFVIRHDSKSLQRAYNKVKTHCI